MTDTLEEQEISTREVFTHDLDLIEELSNQRMCGRDIVLFMQDVWKDFFIAAYGKCQNLQISKEIANEMLDIYNTRLTVEAEKMKAYCKERGLPYVW